MDITININEAPKGDTYVSEGSKGQDAEASPVTQSDEYKERYFKLGFEAAINESKLWYVQGKIEEFWNDTTPKGEPVEYPAKAEYAAAHADEPCAPELWTTTEPVAPSPVIEVIAADPDIRPVTDSGEPLVEALPTEVEEGTWTISNAELQSRLDAEYERGLKAGIKKGLDQADGTKPITTTKALDMIALEINNQVLNEWEIENPKMDGGVRVPTHTISKGDYARRFLRVAAVRLGYDVASTS